MKSIIETISTIKYIKRVEMQSFRIFYTCNMQYQESVLKGESDRLTDMKKGLCEQAETTYLSYMRQLMEWKDVLRSIVDTKRTRKDISSYVFRNGRVEFV